ncbi:MAG: Adenine DNA glycosylase [Alphaproteobacteria bacterium MarineAlpha9_Bin4]|nr:MAG: Adenine DNA glycosylase [Alphaproteobacteria bacterium MarineAlpha9_Bin4]|tara:strand:- start:1454 stop:2518 length:1065 start_codon:yes stop_codon:yes gene_type:complete
MNNIEIKTIQKKIKLYYKKSGRELPWRVNAKKSQDPYKTLISEIMLQQTRVKTVLKYYKKFLKTFPNLKTLALAKEERVLKAWAGMGYYRRALNLHSAAKIILNEYSGKIPEEKKKLIKLPGIGDYTSAAIASFAFGKDEIVIDTNIERFVNRIFNAKYKKTEIYNTKLLAAKVFPKSNKGDFAQAIMDFSNDFCLKINPKCNVCLISSNCNYKKTNNFKITKNKKNKKYCTSYFIVDKKKHFFVRKRPINKILGGMYEVPSTTWTSKKIGYEHLIKIKNKETIGYPKSLIKHEFSHFTLFSEIIIINLANIKKFNFEGKWVNKYSLKNLPISKLTEKIVDYSLEEFSVLNKFL